MKPSPSRHELTLRARELLLGGDSSGAYAVYEDIMRREPHCMEAAVGRAMVGRVPAARVRLMPGQTVALVQPRVAPAVRIPVAAVVAAVGRDNPVARAAPALW